MPGNHFISYSAIDAEKFALKLADDLQAGPPSFPVWIFRRELHAAAGDWDTQVRDAIRDCDSLIFVMSRDSVTDESNCKPEWTAALRFKKPILLVRLHADADTPFRIASRQYVDFVGDYKTALAKLRNDLQWLHSPEGELRALEFRLKDALRDFERASDADRARIQADIDLLRKQIAEQTEAVKNPDAAAHRTEASIAAGLERERTPAEPISGKAKTKFINPPPMTAPRYFQDRHVENKIIADFLRDESKRMLTINGRAGIGKTAMVCRILKALESGQLPDDLGTLSVDGIVYLSAIGTRTINVPNLFADLCQLLPAEVAAKLDALYRDPKISTHAKMLALFERFPSGRVVVLLDNFESVMDATECCVKDAELDEALRALLSAPHHAVKIILTTRIPPRELELFQPGSQAYLPVDAGLESSYAKQLLREMDRDGRVGLKNAGDAILQRACDRTRGFPRALEALYAILAADRYTSLEEILGAPVETLHATSLQPTPPLPENVVEALVGEAFSRLDPTAQKVMQALAVYNRPVTPAAVNYLLQPYLPSVDSALVLNRLANMQFVHKEGVRHYLHSTDRDYAMGRVPRGEEQDRHRYSEMERFLGTGLLVSPVKVAKHEEARWTQLALLNRAADYFEQTRKPRETWKALDDLAPQLNEFDLRCAAEDYDTAANVLLEIDGDYLFLWGHYRLMIELHEKLQDKIVDQLSKESSLGRLGSASAFLGKMKDATNYHEQALTIARNRKDREGEGIYLGNLGNRYADLGQTQRAIEFYEQALAIARDIGDKRNEGNWLGDLGYCYSALSETRRAIEFYEQALAVDREIGYRLGEAQDLGDLADALTEAGRFSEAITRALESITTGEEIASPQIGSESNHALALAHLYNGNLPAARAAAETACKYDEPRNNHNIFALFGIIALRQNDRGAAQEAFTAAIAHADALLAHTPEYFDALDAKGVALCGLALGLDNGQERIKRTDQAVEVFRAAHAINKDAGIVARVVRLLDALALADPQGTEKLAEARRAASGE